MKYYLVVLLSLVLLLVTLGTGFTFSSNTQLRAAENNSRLCAILSNEGEIRTLIRRMQFQAVFSDGKLAFTTKKVQSIKQEGNKSTIIFELMGSSSEDAEVYVEIDESTYGITLNWVIKYWGENKQFNSRQTGFNFDYAKKMESADVYPVSNWVNPTGKFDWEVPEDMPYMDFKAQVRTIKLIDSPAFAIVTSWFEPDWLYNNNYDTTHFIATKMVCDSEVEQRFRIGIFKADNFSPHDLSAILYEEPFSVNIYSKNMGNLFEPGENLNFHIKVRNLSTQERWAMLSYKVFDFYGQNLVDVSCNLSLSEDESTEIPVQVKYSKRGILFVASSLQYKSWNTTAWTSIGIIPKRDSVPPSDSPFGLAAIIGNKKLYPYQPDFREMLPFAQRIGVRWLRYIPFSIKSSYTATEDKSIRDMMELFNAYGISLTPQINTSTDLKDIKVSLGKYSWIASYYEFGNELNSHHSSSFIQKTEASDYVERFLRPFRSIVKEIAPQAKVANHGLGGIRYDYLDGFGEAGGFELCDAISIHLGFHPRAPEWDGEDEFWALLPQLRSLEKALKKYDAENKEIWCTEIYSPSDPLKSGLDPRTAADYLVRANVICLAKKIRVIEWYQLQDGVWYAMIPNPHNREFNFGLLHTDLTPKPSYIAYGTMTEQLEGMTYIGRYDLGEPELFAFMFGSGTESKTVVLWSYLEKHELDKNWADVINISRNPGMPWESRWNQPIKVEVPASNKVEVTDIMGNTTFAFPQNGKVSLVLTGSPIFVKGIL